MLRIALFTSVLAAAALAACDVGEVPTGDGGGGGGEGEASFNAMIAPLVTECSLAGACHAIQQPVLTSFSALTPRYLTKPGMASLIVMKKATLSDGVTHQGVMYLTDPELVTLGTWIDSLP